MYDFWFYVFFWSIGILLALPILVLGVVWVVLQKSSEKHHNLSLEEIDSLLPEVENKKEFKGILEVFLYKFNNLPEDRDDLRLWLGVIEKFVSSKFFDIKQVKDFENNLKVNNEEIQKNISDTLQAAIKTKNKR